MFLEWLHVDGFQIILSCVAIEDLVNRSTCATLLTRISCLELDGAEWQTMQLLVDKNVALGVFFNLIDSPSFRPNNDAYECVRNVYNRFIVSQSAHQSGESVCLFVERLPLND